MRYNQGVLTIRKILERVCKIQRSFEELKQASWSWNLRYDEMVKEFGFIRNGEDACVYKKVSGSAKTYF